MSDTRSRIAPVTRALMTEEQQRVYDEIASGPRGGVRGPLLLWLHSPEYATRVEKVGEFVRWGTVLEARLSELAVLITARHYTAHYVWYVHSALALEGGLAPESLEALKNGRRPDFENADEAVVYDFTTELLTTHRASDKTLDRVKSEFGERGAIELGGIIAYYHLCAITLALTDHPLPDGTLACLPD